MQHKFDLTKDISETEIFDLSDAGMWSSLSGLYLRTSFAPKI
jgi:hypothetical protein